MNFNIVLIDFGACTKLNPGEKLSLKFGTPYYIAPEVLKKSYDSKCDVWSCGIILHTLLIGHPPFLGKDNKEILAKVEIGEYNTQGEKWEKISKEARELLKLMLEKDPEKRISAGEALNHPWLNIWKSETNNLFEEKVLSDIQDNIRNFSAIEKFQQAALAYIVHINNSASQNHELRKVFKSFDNNGDGKLSYNEFMEGYRKICSRKVSEEEINKIIGQMDQNKDEFIEYEEFLRLSLNQTKLVSENNLKLAFDNFDHDKNGSLSKDEIRQVLINADDEYIDELFMIIDTNNDSTITFDEFKKMMEILVSKQ
jgi:calcium-dependent protein kinase